MSDPLSPPTDVLQRLLRAPLIDGHNDLPWKIRQRFGDDPSELDFRDTRSLEPPLHTDLTRLREGGVGAQFFAAYVPVEAAGAGAARLMLEQVEVVHELVRDHSDDLALAVHADDVERIHESGRIACLIGLEGGHGLEGSLAVLRAARRAGARYLTLTHNANTEWADSATEPPRHHGLTDRGRRIVAEMNRLGMLVDLSHTSPETMVDALDASRAPVVFTHSGARAVTDHPRNVPDAVLERVAEGNGLVMATFVPYFVSEKVRTHRAARIGETARIESLHPEAPERVQRRLAEWDEAHPAPRATIADVADHIDHLRDVMGADHVGIGSDFDGIPEVPEGLEDVSCFPALFEELARRGYQDDELRAIAGGNVLRLLRAAERVAAGEEAPEGLS